MIIALDVRTAVNNDGGSSIDNDGRIVEDSAARNAARLAALAERRELPPHDAGALAGDVSEAQSREQKRANRRSE